MNPLIEKLLARFDALSKRERVLIFGAIAVVLVSVTNMLLIEPVTLKQKILRDQLAQQQKMSSQIQSQIEAVVQENSPNSTSPIRMEINRIKQEIAEGDLLLQDSRTRLVQPERMAYHLQKILKNTPQLTVVEMKTMPVRGLVDSDDLPDDKQPAAQGRVYKHGVKLTLRGNYADLVNYLSRLEGMGQLMYWSALEMKVVKYPVSEMTLVVYTLSLDKTWLQV